MYLWYQDSLAGTFYSSSHGGASESVSNVWTSTAQSSYPYLKGVIDPYEQLANGINSRSSWTISFTSQELTSMLQGKGYGVGTSVSALETVYSDTGNVIKLHVHWENGKSNSFGPTEMRYTSWFALPSIHFAINETLPSISTSGSSGSSSGTSTTINSQFDINGTNPISSTSQLYVIDGDGNISSIPNSAYVLTGTGNLEVFSKETSQGTSSGTAGTGSYSSNLLSGSRKVTGDTYHFNGSGWGHNIGMSQFGAYAMAYYQGFSYQDILEFYFPGTNVAKG